MLYPQSTSPSTLQSGSKMVLPIYVYIHIFKYLYLFIYLFVYLFICNIYAQIRTFARSLCFFRVKRPEFSTDPHEVMEGFLT